MMDGHHMCEFLVHFSDMMDVHHKIGYHHMMSAHHFKSESESRLFKRPFSFLSSQRYNEVQSEPLHSCDENGECHL